MRNKLKLLLCPFTLRGHWNRSVEQVRTVHSDAYGSSALLSCLARGCAGSRRGQQVQAARKRHQRAGPVHSAHGLSYVLPAVLRRGRGVYAEPLQARGERCCTQSCLRLRGRSHSLFPPALCAQRLGRFAWWGCMAWGSEVVLLWAGLKSLATSQVRSVAGPGVLLGQRR